MKSFLSFLVFVVVLLHHHHHHQTCDAITNGNNQTYCPPSSCGKITNIKHPFRLKNDSTICGDPRYELSCENNITTLTLFSGKYSVKSINYNNYTIQLVDLGIQEGDCSTIPRYFFTIRNFTSSYNNNYHGDPYEIITSALPVIYLNCSKPVKNNSLYADISSCRINSTNNSYVYAIAGNLRVGELNVGCRVKLVTMSSASAVGDRQNFTYSEIHEMLSYGFELSWMNHACEDSCNVNLQYCSFNYDTGGLQCEDQDYCTTPWGADIQNLGSTKYTGVIVCREPLVVTSMV